VAAGPAWGRGSEPDTEAARRLALEGRCAAALPELERARQAAPGDVELPLLTGECAIRAGRYEEAVRALEDARTLAPERADAALQLAVARYHLGDFAGADEALRAAEARGATGAEVDLYRGLLLLRADSPRAAALALERARSSGGEAVEPVASYYAGLAWARAEDRDAARAALRRVVEGWPGSDWAREAERALAGLAGAKPRIWASLRAGYEYDDNVVLLGNGVALPSEISSQRDQRAAWLLQAGGELLRRGPWSAGAALAYEGWAEATLSEFDLQYPSLVAWLDRQIDESKTLRLTADTDYAWVDADPFYTSEGVGLSLFERFGRYGTSEIAARFWHQNYLYPNTDVPDGPGVVGAPCLDPADLVCGPPGLDESRQRNRDGSGFSLGWVHSLALGERAQLRFGYSYYHFGARGLEYSYNAHQVLTDLGVRLPAGFELRLAASWTDQPFRHPSTFPPTTGLVAGREYGLPGNRRSDSLLDTEVSLARPLTRHLTLSGSWRYQRNWSNVDVFDYSRNVLGAYLTVSL
jgi:tetratricopeptide (TPR) repeat protein